jgi:hypothetical protein
MLTKTHNRMASNSVVSASDYGATAAGLSLAIDAAISLGKDLLIDVDLDITGWSAKTISGSLSIVGNGTGSKISSDGSDFLVLDDGASFSAADIEFDGVGDLLTLQGAADNDSIKLKNVSYKNSGPVCNSVSADIQSIEVSGCVFDTIAGEAVFDISSNIKRASFIGNKFTNMTSSTSVLQVVNLGKTQLADQPNTGNYIISDNLFENITANGNTAGEVHAIILYGERATISNNIIRNIDRPLARQSGGVEGIYTKCRSLTVTGNVLVNAGFADGNKGAMINIKGDDAAGTSATDPIGAIVTVTGNSLFSTDANARNGIRAEPDNITISGNTIRGANGVHAIALAWSNSGSEGAVISGNVVLNPALAGGAIWLNCIGKGISVSGNYIDANQAALGSSGVYYLDTGRSGTMNQLDISGNIIDATNLDYAILLQATAVTVTNISVNDNQIKGGTYGIRTLSATYLTDGEVRRNRMTGTANAFRDKATATLRFSDNTLGNAPTDGFAAEPAAGTWSVGEIVYNSAPTAGGTIGWVCTSAGTPGTWKAFGTIAV